MTFKSIKLVPGLNSQLTPTLNETGWWLGTDPVDFVFTGNMMRFPSSSQGQPEVVGGWSQKDATFVGVPRGLHAWATLPGSIATNVVTPLLAVATSSNLYVYDYTTVHDITVSGGFTASTGQWSMDNFGEDLMAVLGRFPSLPGSAIFTWTPTAGYVPSTRLSGGPNSCNGVVVAVPQQQLIAWGVNRDGAIGGWSLGQDPMLIAWTDYSVPTSWIPLPTNAAGSYRLTQGSRIQTIFPAQGQLLVLTDAVLYGMQFLGGALIYGFQQLGTACGSIGAAAATTLGGKAYWWGSNREFYVYDGVVTPLVCPIRDRCLDVVQPGLAAAQSICASANSKYGEVRWDFSTVGNAATNDSYVSYNVLNQTWAYGTTAGLTPGLLSVGRNAMTDFVPTIGFPFGVDGAGHLWLHEQLNNQISFGAVVTPLPWRLTTGWADIADGENFSFVDWIIPDFYATTPSAGVKLTVRGQSYPTGPLSSVGPFELSTTNIPCRIRGRQIQLVFNNTTNGVGWRLGRVRARIATDGRR